MTDNYAIAIQNTLAAVWGTDGYKTWVEAIPPAIPPLNPKQTALLKAAINLLNWDAKRLEAFLKENMAIATVEDLEAIQIDPLFDFLHSAIAEWQSHSIPGKPVNSLSSLSSRYWEARLALYPEAEAIQRKKRTKWIIDGYNPPEYPQKSQPACLPASQPDGLAEDDDDWLRFEYRECKSWYG